MAKQLAEKGHTFRGLVRENLRLVLAAVAACIFIWLLEEVGEGELTKLDAGAYQLFVQTLRQPWLTPYMESISELAQPVVLLVMLLAVEAVCSGPQAGRLRGGQPCVCRGAQRPAQAAGAATQAGRLSPYRRDRLQLSLWPLHGSYGVLRASRLDGVAL